MLINKSTVSILKRPSLQRKRNEISNGIRFVLRWIHPVIESERFQIDRGRALIKKQKTKASCRRSRDRFLKKDPDMCSPSGTGTLHQCINLILPADQTQSIYFIMPLIVRIGIILFFCSLFVIIKIEHKESAMTVRQQWIHPQYIRTVFPVTDQMLYEHSLSQRFEAGKITLSALQLTAVICRTDRIPAIGTLGIIVSIFRPFRKHVFSAWRSRTSFLRESRLYASIFIRPIHSR